MCSCFDQKMFRSRRLVIMLFYAVIIVIAPIVNSLCHANELEEGLTEIVEDFERHLGRLDDNTIYSIVVTSFIDNYSEKRKKLSSEIENVLTDTIIEKFRYKKNIIVLERRRLKTMERELTFDTGGELTWDKRMFKKLGAGYIITGTFTKMSNQLKIRASMLDIFTGEIVSSSNTKILLDHIDSSLLTDYAQKKEPPPPTQAPSMTTLQIPDRTIDQTKLHPMGN